MKERPLPIFCSNGELIPETVHRLKAICHYPNDLSSQIDCYEFHKATGARILQQKENYEPSQFQLSVETLLAKGIGKRFVAGIVTTYLYKLIESGDTRPTLRRAALNAEQFIKEVKEESGAYPLRVPWREGKNVTIRNERLVTSANNIELRFREFSAVGCLMAARFVFDDDEQEHYDYVRSNETMLYLLATAYEFEKVVYDAVPELFPNPYSVRAKMPSTKRQRVGVGISLDKLPLFV